MSGLVSTKSPMNRQKKVNIRDSMNFYVLQNYLYMNSNNVGDYDVADAIIENCKRIGMYISR